jgi:integrase
MAYFRKRGCKCEGKKCNCDATWSYTIDVGRDPVTNKRIQRTISGFNTKKDAEKAAAEMVTQIERGDYVKPNKETVGAFMLEFVEQTLKNHVAPNTYEARLAFVKNHIIPRIGHIHLLKITPMDIQKFYNELREHYGSGHVQNIGNLLTKAFRQAYEWGMIQKNVAALVKKPPTSRKNTTMKTWSVDEQRAFLDFAKSDNEFYYTLFLLELTSGMRKGEMLGLQWSDVDLKQGVIQVKRTLVYAEKHIYLKDVPKTESSIRSISVADNTMKHLREYKLKQAPNEMNLVFPSPKTNLLLYPNSLDKYFAKTIKAAGLPVISFHGLRHTFATTLLELGVNAKIVQEMLGHSTIKTTMDTYSHVLPNMQKGASEFLNSALF